MAWVSKNLDNCFLRRDVDCTWFGQTHRQAVLDAAAAAGLNVLSLVNSHAAAALQFGIERNFANRTEHVVFYDMGSSSTEVSAQPRSATKVLKVL